MDGPRRYYPKKLNKSDKDKYYMISLICEIFKKKKKKSKHNKTETEFSYREQTDGCWGEGLRLKERNR